MDDSNLAAALHDMRLLGLRDSSVAAAAAALDEMELDEDLGMDASLMEAEELTVSAEPEGW